MSNKARQIIDLRVDGKWTELWFHDGNCNPDSFDECCKSYMLNDVIASANLGFHALRNGIAGIWVLWRDDRPIAAAARLTDLRGITSEQRESQDADRAG